MRRVRSYITLCVSLLLWMACTTENNRNTSLQHAIQTVDNNPQEALLLLENISNPELLDKNNYSYYVTILKQAQYMNDQDITNDSTILDAQRYFVEISNYEMAARASFYVANYYREKKVNDKMLEYFLFANHYAQLAGNHLFRAKSTYWLGISYYNQDMLDSSRVYYLQALELYKNEQNADNYKLDITNMLGQIHLKQQNLEQAGIYFDSGLIAIREVPNAKYEARFLHNKAVVLREKMKFSQAKEFLNQALAANPDTEDMMRIYLSYAKLWKVTNQPDSTIYYLNLVEGRISEITYPYTRRAIYKELAAYYEMEGDIPKMKHYTKLETIEDKHISDSQNEKKMLSVVKSTKEQCEQQIHSERKTSRLNILYIICVAVVLLLLGWRYFRKQKAKLNNRYEKLRDKHLFQGLDLNRVLINGLRSIAKSMDLLNQEKKTRLALLTSVGEEFQMLRETFNSELAELAGKMLKQFPNGAAALRKLNKDELCILRLTQMKHSDKAIGWMLGLKVNLEDYVLARKSRIRQTMAESGMSEQDIRLLFTPIIKI